MIKNVRIHPVFQNTEDFDPIHARLHVLLQLYPNVSEVRSNDLSNLNDEQKKELIDQVIEKLGLNRPCKNVIPFVNEKQ